MGYTSLTDEEIIGHLVQGASPRLFDELVRRHQPGVLRQCLRQLKDTEAACDVSQEVWIGVHTKLGRYRAEGTFAAWLAAIVHRRCHDHLQKDKRRLHREISRQMAGGLEEDEAMDTENLSIPTVGILEELMEQLGGEEKRLLHLKYWQGWPVHVIQQHMQLSESAVKSRLFHVRKKLQKLLDTYRRHHPLGGQKDVS